MPKTIAVFCSASAQVAPMFFSEAEKLGRELAQGGFSVIYGGAKMGLMGALAEGVLSAQGQLIGAEGSQSERKAQMILQADAFIVFPGGLGTLDEATEVLGLQQDKVILAKPLIFYNFLGIWTPLLEALDLLYQAAFISAPCTDLFQVFEQSRDVLEYLKHEI